ncbi:carbohydrate ABC transporter permease [Spirochaeta isovalerica]|uniref:Multiple sugar transport system permease protein n=1 Tax=Spirochaeta isovalerica TaxID=150 RepID=A0A841R4X5_9SPIO|nr:sugar ABC transporter permease [Spirochaeta isovalerica]MBB6478866.1 multiple sugar transport system permease protein [Spirochaeta isovalerica]
MNNAIKKLDRAQRESALGWGLILPAALIIALLVLYPIVYNIYLSFFDTSLSGRNTFIGLSNYQNVVFDIDFWKAVLTTLIYVVFTTAGTTVFGLIVALVMNQRFPLRGLVRSLLLLPYVAPVISVVYSWKFIFDPVNGIFMDLTVEKMGLFAERFNLIGSPSAAIWVVIVFSIWRNFPFTYLMILSRLQAIDRNLYEAADIDGCGGWAKFRYITLPEVYFVTGSIVLLRIIWNFNKFEDIYLLADNVEVLSVYTYFKAFTGAMEMGQGSSLAVIQFLLLIGFIIYYVKKVLKW